MKFGQQREDFHLLTPTETITNDHWTKPFITPLVNVKKVTINYIIGTIYLKIRTVNTDTLNVLKSSIDTYL